MEWSDDNASSSFSPTYRDVSVDAIAVVGWFTYSPAGRDVSARPVQSPCKARVSPRRVGMFRKSLFIVATRLCFSPACRV